MKKKSAAATSNKKNNTKLMSGIIKRHPDGFGFFIPDEMGHPDAYVPAHFMLGAMTFDRVSVEVEQEGQRERYWARIKTIDKRHWQQVVAPLQLSKSKTLQWMLPDTEGAWGQPIQLLVDNSVKGLTNDILVLAQITQYPDDGKPMQAKLIKVLGPAADAKLDVERVAHGHHIPFEFSAATIKQAKTFKPEVNPKDFKHRQDLRHLDFITIDGATAKDFDDAIFVKKDKNQFQLLVAIADVSHYVQPDSAIDKDAYERGTSSYFPNYVIPMLPEILSNELCSLKPKVPRLAFVCSMNFDNQGHLTKYDFYEAVIESKARVTYGQAQEILDGQELKEFAHIAQMLRSAKPLADLLLKKRLEDGSLELDIAETQVIVDKSGEPLDIIKTHRLFAHRLIEEFMLVANIATARFFDQHELYGLYRVHEDPKPDALEQLARFGKSFALHFDFKNKMLQKTLRQGIDQLKNTPQGEIFSNLVLRSMKQAKYSAHNIGHFGLAFEHYAHFTSPIRRYPDLINHRVIKACLNKKNKQLPTLEQTETYGTWLSATEQRAVKAERAIIGIKKARYISKHVGETFNGSITSVTKFGVFVTLRQFEVEGLVHVDNLSKNPQSRWEYDEDRLTLFERRSGKKYQIGDSIEILVSSANIMDGKVDFLLAANSKNQTPKNSVAKKSETLPASKSKTVPNSAKVNPPKASSSRFDPGKRLIEALTKKGLRPSNKLLAQESSEPISSASKNSRSEDNRFNSSSRKKKSSLKRRR